MCSDNFCPFNLNYVTKILYLHTLSIINVVIYFDKYIVIYFEGGDPTRKKLILPGS